MRRALARSARASRGPHLSVRGRRRLDLALYPLYVTCMASKSSTTVRLDPEDVRALARARRDGLNMSELIRRGLRVVAAKYYRGKRPPTTGLFVSTDAKLGSEEDLFGDLDEES